MSDTAIIVLALSLVFIFTVLFIVLVFGQKTKKDKISSESKDQYDALLYKCKQLCKKYKLSDDIFHDIRNEIELDRTAQAKYEQSIEKEAMEHVFMISMHNMISGKYSYENGYMNSTGRSNYDNTGRLGRYMITSGTFTEEEIDNLIDMAEMSGSLVRNRQNYK